MKSDVDKKFYADLGQRISAARKAADITQTALAERLDIGQQTMGHYESGRLRIPIRLLKQIAEFLDMPYDSLIDGQPIDSSPPAKRGPRSAIETTFLRVAELPRHKQKSIQDVVEAMLLKEAS